MPPSHVIAIGTSAGGVEALVRLVADLPPDLPAAVLIVLHVPTYGFSVLPEILSRKGALPASHPENGQALEAGRIYIAPPDCHLIVKDGTIELARGPKENGHRPAIDPLLRSVGAEYGSNAIGVILTGALDDGTAGLHSLKRHGGVAIVQDPNDALFPSMPKSALENVAVDHVLPLARIAQTLADLTAAPPASYGQNAEEQPMDANPIPSVMSEEPIAQADAEGSLARERAGIPSSFACPECHGALWEVTEGQILRYRCRTGHAYSAGSLLMAQSEALEAALWTALRALEEKASLVDRLAVRSRERGHDLAAVQFEQTAREARRESDVVRHVLVQRKPEPNGLPTSIDEPTMKQGEPIPEGASASPPPRKNGADIKKAQR